VFSFLKSRGFVTFLAVVLIAIFIWFAGPYFAFGTIHPLESEFARLIAIGLVVAWWLLSAVLRWLRARQATEKLVSAVLSTSRQEKEQPSAEAVKLRERFEGAVAILQKQNRRGSSLYDLPWYVFIGAPGSGKTTALINSGLKFPLEQRVGKGAVRGVGGTRNCDWWFTDEAVFLDTAGRYTTQDSDAASDSEGWKEFLTLLGKYRKRRPVNGIVLTISTHDLMTQGDGEREAHVEAARRRLNEFTRELHIQLPVYVMVTKCDMVAGFTEYFDDLTQEGRAQVWGVTFPYEQTVNGEAPERFGSEFDALMSRLNGRLFPRLEEERGARRRATIFAFPQQMAALRDRLDQFISDVFSSTHVDEQILLRGVYFTSGTQDGTQIDRLLGAVGRRFGVAPEAVAAPAGRGKAYFVERLLKTLVIGESGLAGVNRRLEVQKAAWQLGAYAAITLVVVGGLIALSVSYAANKSYLAQVGTDVAALRKATPSTVGASLEALVPYLNAVRAVADSANRHQDDIPWSMRWGLYQGASVGNSATDAYMRELDSIVLPRFGDRIKRHLAEYGSEPEKLYFYLKAYLMLGDPRHLDKKHLEYVADLAWKPSGNAPGTTLTTHFRTLLENGDTLRPIPLDASLVAQARSTIRQASIPQIMYTQLQRAYSEETKDDLRLDVIAGVGIEKVLRRKSGGRLSEPIPGFYTPKVFKEVTGPSMLLLVKQFADEEWVWGTGAGLSAATFPKLTEQVTDLYERHYISTWETILNDLEIVPFATVEQYADALTIIVGPTSPLRGTLKTVVDNTSLVIPEGAPAAGTPSMTTRLTEGAKDLFNKTAQKVTGAPGRPAGTLVTQRFTPIHKLMNGAPAPFDAVLEQVRKIRDQLLKLGPQVGGTNPLTAIADPAVLDLWRGLQQDAANLPAPVDSLVAAIGRHAGGSVSFDATKELEKLYVEEIVARCRVRVQGRYPFGDGGEMALADFGEVFGPGGLFDKFFTDHLDKLVDRSQRPWTWRSESVQPLPGMLKQFAEAERIREMFFSAGSKTPLVAFIAVLSNLDAAATRFYVNIDGQQAVVTPGIESRTPMEWPGSNKRSLAVAIFEDRTAAPEQARGFDSGPWALFKLIDDASAPSAPGQADNLESTLRFQTAFHKAQVVLQATNAASNPFASRDWRQFKCES
jgi:type VI secretion system protein ImpL